MPISRTPLVQPFPVWAVHEERPSVERFAPLPKPEWMKKTVLFGIPLKSALTQQELQDDAIQYYINEAISEVEHILDLYITPVEFHEKHDYDRHGFTWNYNYLKVNHANILHVSALELTFSNSNIPGFVQFPLENVHVMPQEGVVQLVPAFGTSLSGFLLSAFSGTQFNALRAVGMTNFPGGVRIKYTSGFLEHKVPALLVDLIATIAGLKILSILGPLLFPFNSTSVSTDGVSQSNSTLGPAFFRQRIEELSKIKDTQMDAAKGYYQRRFLVDYF